MIGCIFTLVAVILYFEFSSIGFLRLFFLLLGIALTAVGVFISFRSSGSQKDRLAALAVHVLLWVFGRVVNWLVGPVIALAVVYVVLKKGRVKGERGQGGEMTLADLPSELYNGTTTYVRKGKYDWGVEYANSANSGETFTITTIYSASSGQVHTNAGVFWVN